ncbi:hypothetical protein SAMN04487969_12149 [Paenibacillus algorifonticola]|uniref:Uncharacterized protein n=1 Tax=Paenibacillus algorifonticola TaxID=684063 RepID=A0A1I2HC04_9BACL|nr:hypothetical protein SAMN04487969_12149 [Paenibacillus algorifonticola]
MKARLGNFVLRTVEAGLDIRYNVTYIWKYLLLENKRLTADI